MLLSVDYVFTNLVLVLIRNVIEFFAFFMMKLIEGERFSLGRPKMLCFAFDFMLLGVQSFLLFVKC